MRTLALALFTVILCLSNYSAIKAESLSVSLSVGDTLFALNGYSSPGSVITLKENTSILATTVAGSNGAFSLTITIADGLHTFSYYAVDASGIASSTITQTVSLPIGQTTTLGNLVMPPTFTVHNGKVEEGAAVDLSGLSVPNSTITIFLNNSQFSTVTTDSLGSWGARINTGTYPPGNYVIWLKASTNSGNYSADSLPYTLTIRSKSSLLSPSPNPQISATSLPHAKSLPKLSWWLKPFDINSDDKLTLGELKSSLLIWAKSLSSKSGTCDLDHDFDCDLIDFSILLYYYQ